MTETTREIEIWIAIDSDGAFSVSSDPDDCPTCNVGSHNRLFHLTLNVPMPRVTEVKATIPETDQPVTITVT